MVNDVVTIKRIGKKNDIVKISIEEGIEVSNAVPQLSQLIDNCYKNNMYKIILDMQRIKFPSSSFIALLVEKTVQARRVNGELKLINLAPSAVNNLVTFSTLNYLSIDEDEGYAVEELEILKTSGLVAAIPPAKTETTPEKYQPVSSGPISAPSKPSENIERQEPPVLPILKETPIAPFKPDVQNVSTKPTATAHEKGAEVSSTFNVSPQPAPIKEKPVPEKETLTPVKPSAVQTSAKPQNDLVTQKIRVKSQVESLYDICDFVTRLADLVGFSEKEVGKIKVTIYEACLNVIEHAYHSDPDEWIVVTVQYNDQDLIITIQDWGQRFHFDDSKPYDVNQAVQDRQTGGFGLFIIRRSMDAVKYKTDPVNGNRLILTKHLPGQS